MTLAWPQTPALILIWLRFGLPHFLAWTYLPWRPPTEARLSWARDEQPGPREMRVAVTTGLTRVRFWDSSAVVKGLMTAFLNLSSIF